MTDMIIAKQPLLKSLSHWITREDYEKTIKLAIKIRDLGGKSTFAVQTPYPGTYIFKNAKQMDINILHNDWNHYHHLNPVIETKDFTEDDLKRMLQTALSHVHDRGTTRKSFRSIAHSKTSNSFIN